MPDEMLTAVNGKRLGKDFQNGPTDELVTCIRNHKEQETIWRIWLGGDRVCKHVTCGQAI